MSREKPWQLKMYRELADWFHLLTAPKDYAAEASQFRRIFTRACSTPAKTLLELGSGGGNNASHLKRYFQMTLVDRSTEMLVISEKLNPECEHLEGDMRKVRLKRQFDAVFIHDAISYIVTQNDLKRVLETAYEHCKPGGAALFVPDEVRETFEPVTKHGGHDGDERSMRYLEWTWDPNPNDETYVMAFAYLLRDADGEVRFESETHTMGLFSEKVWLSLVSEVGFDGHVEPTDHGPCFVGVRPTETINHG